jgi:RHS repeat-associated protein
MGCLKLTYREELPQLKVVSNNLKISSKGCTGFYRYGFQGQEKDDEISGVGNSNTAQFWQYDTRLGRRWNVDPIVKYFESSYASYGNNPILNIDPNGADWFTSNGSKPQWHETTEKKGKMTGWNSSYKKKK